jgi:hypothetical protein
MKRVPTWVWLGFGFGLLSPLLQIVAGLPALYFSYRGLRAVNLSDGELGGRRLAVAGMVLGAIGTLLSVVGFLAIVLIPFLSLSHRAECMNRLRMIGEGLNVYAQERDAFPPATRDPQRLAPDRRISWMADVLPRMAPGGRPQARFAEIASKIDREAAWEDPQNAGARNSPVVAYLCPGHPQYDPRQRPAPTHYVGCAGVGEKAAYLPREDAKAGLFGHDRGVREGEVETGLAYTFAALETAWENGPWLAGDHPTVRGLPLGEKLLGPGHAFGGMHRGITHILMMDGSVRIFHNDTAAAVLQQQACFRE